MPIVLQNALHSVPILVTVSGTSQYIRKRTCLVASTWLSRQQQQIWLKEEAEDYGILMKFSFWRQLGLQGQLKCQEIKCSCSNEYDLPYFQDSRNTIIPTRCSYI